MLKRCARFHALGNRCAKLTRPRDMLGLHLGQVTLSLRRQLDFGLTEPR